MTLVQCMITRIFITIFILLSVQLVQARQIVQSNQTLDNFFQRAQSMKADFEQTIFNSQGQLLEQSTGYLILSRPDKFILSYELPSQQQYISNGKTIWIYDVELEQVSIKSVEEGMGDSPAMLLSSNSNIYQHYIVEDVVVGQSEGMQWVQLISREAEGTFERVLLAFKDHHLMRMKLFDSFGQITELKLSDVKINQSYTNHQFEFIPPDDVDVIGTINAQ